jgi:hypothetical protein
MKKIIGDNSCNIIIIFCEVVKPDPETLGFMVERIEKKYQGM